MSEKNIDINELNAPADIRLGGLYNPEPTQQEPELKYNATVPYYIGRSANNSWNSILSVLTEPFDGGGLNTFTEKSNNARMGLAPNTLLSEIKDIGNWGKNIKTQQSLYPSFTGNTGTPDFEQWLNIENMLSGGTPSGVLGRSVDQTAQKRLIAGYYINPYFKINANQQLIENRDGFEQRYDEYVNSVKLTNQANKDAKLPEIQLLSQEELYNAFKKFNDTGAWGRWVANLSAEDGWFSFLWTIKNPLTGFGLVNPLNKVEGGFELATYQNPFNINETPVISLGKDVVDFVAKEDPNFNGPEWFSQLELPVEVRHQMLLNGIDTSSFVGSRGKNEALFTLQNLMFTTTLRDKNEDFLKKNEFWNSKTGSIVKIGAALPNMIVSDPDTGIAIGTSILSAGLSLTSKVTAVGLSAMKFTGAAANTMKATGVVLNGLGTATALSIGGIPRFLKYANWGTKLGYSIGTGSLIMVARNFKDQQNKIAFTMAGLEEQGKYSYDLSEAATAAFDGAIFGGVMHGVHVGAGYLKNKIRIELNGGVDMTGYSINGLNTKMRPAVTDLYFGEKFKEAQLLDRSAGKYPPLYLSRPIVRKEERQQYDQVALGLTPERQLHLDSLTETLITESNNREQLNTLETSVNPSEVVDGSVLHTIRNIEDLPGVLENGLREGTNVTMDGGKPNQSIGDGITLVYHSGDVEFSSKGYNFNDGIVSRQNKARPKAILIESEQISMRSSETYSNEVIISNIERIEKLMKIEDGKIKDHNNKSGSGFKVIKSGFKTTEEALRWSVDNMKQNDKWSSQTNKNGSIDVIEVTKEQPIVSTPEYSRLRFEIDQWYNRLDALLEAQKTDPSLTQIPGVSKQEAIKKLLGELPDDIDIYLYDANEDGQISNLRKLESSKAIERDIPITPLTEGEKLAVAKDSFSDRSTLVEATDLREVPESGIFSRVEGEAPVSHAVRLLNANQIGGVLDIHPLTEGFGEGRLEATKQLSAYKKALRVLEFINDNKNESMSDQLELFGVGLDPKVAVKLPQLIKELNSVIKQVEEHTADQVAKDWSPEVSSSMTKNQRVTFQEDLSYQRARLESGVEAKQIYQALDQAVEDGTFTKNYRDAIVKVLTTLGELPKEEVPELTNAKPAVKKTQRMGIINERNSARKVPKPAEFTKAQQSKARAAYQKPYSGSALKNKFIRMISNKLSQQNVSLEARLETIKLLSANLANLELNPARLIKWENAILRDGAGGMFEGYAQPSGYSDNRMKSGDSLFGFNVNVNADVAKGLVAKDSVNIVRVVLHELGHIYSFVLQPEEVRRVTDLYTDNVNLSFLNKFKEIGEALDYAQTDASWYRLKDVDEFFAQIFEQNIYSKTAQALKVTPKKLSLDMITMLTYFKHTWNSVKNLIGDTNIVELNREVDKIIKIADQVEFRSLTDAASIGTDAHRIQMHIANRLPTKQNSISGFQTINGYNIQLKKYLLDALEDEAGLRSLIKQDEFLTEEQIKSKLKTIKKEMEDGINNLFQNKELNEAELLHTIFFKDYGVEANNIFLTRLSDMFNGKKNNAMKAWSDYAIEVQIERIGSKYRLLPESNEINILQSQFRVASFLLPNRITELLETLHADSERFYHLDNTKNPFNMNRSRLFLKDYLVSKTSNDNYKGTSVLYALPRTLNTDVRLATGKEAYALFKNISQVVSYANKSEGNLDGVIMDLLQSDRENTQPASLLAGTYMQQFMFLDDILENIDKTFGIKVKKRGSFFDSYSYSMVQDNEQYINSLVDSPFVPAARKNEIIKMTVRGGKETHKFNNFLEAAAEMTNDTHLRSMVYAFLHKLNLSENDFSNRLQETLMRLIDVPDIDKQVAKATTTFKLAKLVADEILGPDKVEIIKKNLVVRKKLIKDNPELAAKIVAKEAEVASAIANPTVELKQEPLTLAEIEISSDDWKSGKNSNYLSKGPDLTVEDISILVGLPSTKLRNTLWKALSNYGVRIPADKQDMLGNLSVQLNTKDSSTYKAFAKIVAENKNVKGQVIGLAKDILRKDNLKRLRDKQNLSSTGDKQSKELYIIDNDANPVDFAYIANTERVKNEKYVEAALVAIQQLPITTMQKERYSEYARLKVAGNKRTDQAIATIMGITEDDLTNTIGVISTALENAEIDLQKLDGSLTDMNSTQLAAKIAKQTLEKATIDALKNPAEAAKTALKPLRERMAASDKRTATKEIFKDIATETPTEPLIAMPVVNKSKTKATMYATTLDGTTESVPSGTVLVPHEIATTIAESKDAEITTQVVVDMAKPTIELVSGPNLIETLKNTPESVFAEVGMEKDLLIETLSAVNNPEEVLMDILKEAEKPVETITIKDKATRKTKAVIVLEPEAAKVTGVIDNTVESPTVRNVGTEPVKVDPSIVIESTVKNAEKEVIIFDKVTGESPDLKPMIVAGTSDRVELSPIDKFDSEVMAGKESLRLNGQDPKFIKYFLLKFNKLSSALVKNIGVKIDALPKEFENLLAEVQSYYLAISEHNRSNYPDYLFNSLNEKFWREFDKEVVSDLAARATPLSEMKPKKLGEIIKAASDKVNEFIAYHNKVEIGSVKPERVSLWADFLPPISPDDFILSPLDAKESTFITEVRLRPKSEGQRLFKLANQKRITAKTIVEDFKLTPLIEPVETAKPTEAAKPTEPVKEMDTVDTITESLADDLKKRMEDKKNSKDRNGFLRKWWINYSDNHTMHHTTLNWWSRIWRGSAKEITADANMVSRFMRLASGLIQTKSAEGKTIRSLNNVMRLMSSFVENGKLMSHQFVKAGTEAFKTFEASASQNFREIIPLYDAQTKFNNAVGNMQMARDLQWNMIKAKAKTKGVLVDSELEKIILTYKPKATKEFIKTVIQRAKELQQVDINDNKLLIDLEVQTKWGRMVDRNGKQMDPNEYHSMTVDSNLVGTQNRTTILESMADVRSQTLLSEDTLDGNIMFGMGWLTEGTRKNRTIWSRDNRSGVRISDMADSPFDRTTLKMLEAKAKLDGENRYAPGTDLEKIWQLNDKNNHKYFSYIDPATLEVVICSMPEIKAELSAGDLLKYNETVTGSLDYLSPFWLDRFKNKSVLEVTMEELLQYKTRTGRYSPHNTTSDTGKAVIGLFGSGNTYEGFAVRNLSIDEVLNSKVLKDIFRYEYFSTKKNFRQSRGFELLVQREIDRQLGVTGFRASEFFESGRQIALEGAGSNDKMVDHINGGFSRISDDYNSYAGNLPSINSKYNNVDQVVSNIGTNIVRVASAPKWAIRSLAEPLVLLTDELVGKNFGDSINGVFKIFKTYVLRDKKSFEKNAVNNLIFGIREVMNHQERFLSEADDILSSSLGRNRWVDRLLRTKENGTMIEKGFDILGNFGVEAGGSRELSTAARGIAIVKFVREFALTIDKAKDLLVLMEKPENRKIAAELNQLSRSKTAGSVKLSKHFKTLARDARFGGDWVTAAQYVRFNLLNKETLDAISFAFKDMGVQDGRVDMAKFREWTQAYTTNGIGPISKETMHQAYHDFSYAIETRVSTDGMISESRGLNRDLSIASRTPLGRFMKSLLQWSASYQSNVLQNGGLMTPAGVILKALIVYNVYTYLTDLLVEYARGRDPKDIVKELQDPKTYVFRMASSTPVLGRYQSILTEGLATASLLTGGKFHSFGVSTDVPAAAVANSWIRKMGKSVKALATDRNLSAGEVAGHIGNLAQVNNLINGSPIGVGASTMQQMGIIEQGDALDAYLKIARGNSKSLNKYGGVQPASNTNYDYSPSSETPYELKRRKTYEQMKQIEKLNKIMEKPKSLVPMMINIKGVSYDLAKKLNEMNQQ